MPGIKFMVLNLRTLFDDNIRWIKLGKCYGKVCGPYHENPDWDDPWFDDHEVAQDFCNGESDGVICPVRESCLQYALVNNSRYGVWGGMTPRGRQGLRKRWPPRKLSEPRDEWHYMREEEAVQGVDPADLDDE